MAFKWLTAAQILLVIVTVDSDSMQQFFPIRQTQISSFQPVTHTVTQTDYQILTTRETYYRTVTVTQHVTVTATVPSHGSINEAPFFAATATVPIYLKVTVHAVPGPQEGLLPPTSLPVQHAPFRTAADFPSPQVQSFSPAANPSVHHAQPFHPGINLPMQHAQFFSPVTGRPVPQMQAFNSAAKPPVPLAQPFNPATNLHIQQAQSFSATPDRSVPQVQSFNPAANPPAPQAQPFTSVPNPSIPPTQPFSPATDFSISHIHSSSPGFSFPVPQPHSFNTAANLPVPHSQPSSPVTNLPILVQPFSLATNFSESNVQPETGPFNISQFSRSIPFPEGVLFEDISTITGVSGNVSSANLGPVSNLWRDTMKVNNSEDSGVTGENSRGDTGFNSTFLLSVDIRSQGLNDDVKFDEKES